MAKNTCEASLRVEMHWLRRHNYLGGHKYGTLEWTSGYGRKNRVGAVVDTASPSPYIRFTYTQTDQDGEKTEFDYKVWFRAIPCRFGGRRFYFICPLIKNGVRCERTASIIYMDGKWFGCRKCHNLAYESQQEPRGGMLGALAKYWSRSDRSETKRARMRVKFWKGKPTKRYQRLLDHDERFGDFDQEQTERKLMALLGRNSELTDDKN